MGGLSVPAVPSSVKMKPNSASYLLQISDRREIPAPLWVLTDLFFVLLWFGVYNFCSFVFLCFIPMGS